MLSLFQAGLEPSAIPNRDTQHATETSEPAALSTEHVNAALALELVAGLAPANEIFERHGLSMTQAEALLQSPTFQKLIHDAKSEWDASHNTPKRIQQKALTCLEKLITPTIHMAANPDTPAVARVNAIKTFERLAGMANTEEAHGPQFTLTLNLGDNNPQISGNVIGQQDYDSDESIIE